MSYIIPANTTHLFMKYPNATFKAYDNSDGSGALTTQIQFIDYARTKIGFTVQTNSIGYVSSTEAQARFGLFVDRPAIITVEDANGPITQWAVNGGTTTGDVNDAPLYDWNGNNIFSANSDTAGHIPPPPTRPSGGGQIWTGVKRDFNVDYPDYTNNILYESDAGLADDEYIECVRCALTSANIWRDGFAIELEPGRGPRDRELLIIAHVGTRRPSIYPDAPNGIPAVTFVDTNTAPPLRSIGDDGLALPLPLRVSGQPKFYGILIICGESEYYYQLSCMQIWTGVDGATLWIRLKIYDDDIVFVGSSSAVSGGDY